MAHAGSYVFPVRFSFLKCFLAAMVVAGCSSFAAGQNLEQILLSESAATLAQAAAATGDAQRGAILFYQPYMACIRCHSEQADQQRIGPSLTGMDPKPTDVELIEAVLLPSKVIKTGYETLTVVTDDGRAIQGTLIERNDAGIVLCDAANNFERLTIPKDHIEEERVSDQSLMPAGQVNALTSRQQFLDLIRYLMEIRDGGLDKARELEPPPALYAAASLPEYEKTIDHAGMIRGLDAEAARRGAAIYARVCANCHGTHDQAGSLPTSLRFAEGKFKNGNDPFAMYQTLTRGFGLMTPQTWMVPAQKYDVIHYIREAYLKERNPSQYFAVSDEYLNGLPKGSSRGPAPRNIEPWRQMDYGPNLVATYEVGDHATNFAHKGNAIRLDSGPGGVSHGSSWMILDYDTLRMAAAWTGKDFIDYAGINFDGRHNSHPRIVGTVHFSNPTGPGWARPGSDSFADDRAVGRDGRMYGPLPREWAQYRGMYYHGNEMIVSYTVGQTSVLETPEELTAGEATVFARHFEIGPRDQEMLLQVAHVPELVNQSPAAVAPPRRASQALDKVILWSHDGTATTRNLKAAPTSKISREVESDNAVLAGLATLQKSDIAGFAWSNVDGNLRLRIPRGANPLRFALWITRLDRETSADERLAMVSFREPARDLSALTHGGPSRFPDVVATKAEIGDDRGPFAVDVLTYPLSNPWNVRMRLTGHDFYADGDRAAVCDWDGNIWQVSGLSTLHQTAPPKEAELTWRRIASGLFQPLGLKIIDDVVHVTCRDQLCRLHDLNGDEAIDWYECVNNDHQVTEHFHEFAMGLQTDAEGNFYYAKSARHALPALVPHHGTLLRISKDGSRTDIVASGFRAANGVCVNRDGTFIVTDQEGHWNPKNRINWVEPGGFYGNMYGYSSVTDESDGAMEQPLCWITNAFDRSPAELLWVESDKWGPLAGRLLNLSYGYGKVYVVPHETVNGQVQGGMIELPIPQFPTGVMRGRFHPADGQLYLTGMFAWAGNQSDPGGFYRLRSTGKPVCLPVELHARKDTIELEFTDDLDPAEAAKVANYQIKVWDLKRTENYGSPHLNERYLAVARASLDGRKVVLEVPDVAPTWCMEICYRLKSAIGENINGTIHNTIHHLGE